MATTNIDVSKQSVLDLLKSGKETPFLIPEYQRPYAWSDDEIETLFDDIWEFSIERTTDGGPQTYFLGSIVSYENANGKREIIDGQQRITSLFLLLRAVYAKLENEETKSKEVLNFISKIKPALWREDEMTGEVDMSQILLRSEVVTDKGNEILRDILQTGVAKPKAKDNYSKNYNKFIELYEEKAKNSPNQIYQFIVSLLNYCILLPISANDQDTALTIFSTLNNRGLPLSDADIFKSTIYKQLNTTEKTEFVALWKEIEADSAKVGETLQSLFYYHMFYLRAIDGDDKTTTPGVRKYYLDKSKNRLTPAIINNLAESLNLWKVVNGRNEIEDEPWSTNIEILKVLDCLSSYTNEFWKYPVVIYYNQHKNKEGFEQAFLQFLKKLCVMLVTRYLEVPAISAVKGDILKLNVQIINNMYPKFFAGFKDTSSDDVSQKFISPHRNVVRMLLKILAYNNKDQKALLPVKWEIEHIFPQKWDKAYFSISEEDANTKLEQLGNKIPLEKPMNIRASNNYFSTKKDQYKKSSIAIAKQLGETSDSSWILSNIENRNTIVGNELTDIINMWVNEYKEKDCILIKPQPTPEQAEMIRQLKQAGLI